MVINVSKLNVTEYESDKLQKSKRQSQNISTNERDVKIARRPCTYHVGAIGWHIFSFYTTELSLPN